MSAGAWQASAVVARGRGDAVGGVGEGAMQVGEGGPVRRFAVAGHGDREVVDAAGLQPGENVLDIGSGVRWT